MALEMGFIRMPMGNSGHRVNTFSQTTVEISDLCAYISFCGLRKANFVESYLMQVNDNTFLLLFLIIKGTVNFNIPFYSDTL